MSIKIVGFQSGHDVAYCILEDGIPVIHEEWERIIRSKMEYGDGLKFFFERQKETSDIKYFTFGNIGGIDSRRYRPVCRDEASRTQMYKIISKNGGEFFEFGHHLSHAANAFYTSEFERALIVSIDGNGFEEGLVPTSLTFDEGNDNKIKRILITDIDQVKIGSIYNHATKWVFGLSVGPPKGSQEGTVMAMSALGEPKYTGLFGDYKKNMPELKRLAEISEQEKFNVAASLQQYTEKTFHYHLKRYIHWGGHENLCLSGGASLNCVMIGKIKEWFPQIKNVFCDPVPYDAGLALGSARYLWHHVLGNPRIYNNIQNISPYLGKTYSEDDIKKAYKPFLNKINIVNVSDAEVLTKLENQKIVAVFGGCSESGRRALGNRSILADPRKKEMKDKINQKIKHREWFRPFAPSILEEKVDQWFEENYSSPYMSFALKFRPEMKDKVPAVVHFDGTARLQTVNKKLHPWFHKFLTKWEKNSSVPMLLNTSFNDSEPIVETPEDALKCFFKTGLDYLYFFDYGILIEKR